MRRVMVSPCKPEVQRCQLPSVRFLHTLEHSTQPRSLQALRALQRRNEAVQMTLVMVTCARHIFGVPAAGPSFASFESERLFSRWSRRLLWCVAAWAALDNVIFENIHAIYNSVCEHVILCRLTLTLLASSFGVSYESRGTGSVRQLDWKCSGMSALSGALTTM